MRIRYCKILQSIKIDEEEDSWLTPLEDISVITKPSRPLALTRFQQIKKYFGLIWQLLHPSTPGPSYEWLVLESVRPQTITTRMKSYFRKINSSKNNKQLSYSIASSKIAFIFFGASPTYLSKISKELIIA